MQLIERKWNQGYDVYILTFLFNSVGNNKKTKVARMKEEIEIFYSRLATRVSRKPSTKAGHRLLPFMLLYPDTSVYKSAKRSLSFKEITTNDGMHMHGVCAADRRGKIKQFLDEYFQEHQRAFTTRKLRKVHVERVTHLPGYVTDYALKSMKRPWFEIDDLIVLPKTVGEVSCG